MQTESRLCMMSILLAAIYPHHCREKDRQRKQKQCNVTMQKPKTDKCNKYQHPYIPNPKRKIKKISLLSCCASKISHSLYQHLCQPMPKSTPPLAPPTHDPTLKQQATSPHHPPHLPHSCDSKPCTQGHRTRPREQAWRLRRQRDARARSRWRGG